MADAMFLNNFLALICSIIGFAQPSNGINNAIGALSLLLGNVLLHSWYGFMKYPIAFCDWDPVSAIGDLEVIRENLSAMIHGGDQTYHPQTTQSKSLVLSRLLPMLRSLDSVHGTHLTLVNIICLGSVSARSAFEPAIYLDKLHGCGAFLDGLTSHGGMLLRG